MGGSSSKAENDSNIAQTSWLNVPLEEIMQMSESNVVIASTVFQEFAMRPQTLCIIRFDQGEVHRYAPASMHKLKFEDPRVNQYEEGVRVVHKTRGPGVITDISRDNEEYILKPELLLSALDLLYGHEGYTAQALTKLRRKIFFEADHDGNERVDFIEFLSFAVRFLSDGAKKTLVAAERKALGHAARILHSWSEQPSNLTKMTKAQAFAFVDVFAAFAEGELEVVENSEQSEFRPQSSLQEATEKKEARSPITTLREEVDAVDARYSKRPTFAGSSFFATRGESKVQFRRDSDYLWESRRASKAAEREPEQKRESTRSKSKRASKALYATIEANPEWCGATVSMLKHVTTEYTFKSLQKLKVFSEHDVAHAGAIACPTTKLPADEWHIVFGLLANRDEQRRLCVTLLDFVNLCVQLKHHGSDIIQVLERAKFDDGVTDSFSRESILGRVSIARM